MCFQRRTSCPLHGERRRLPGTYVPHYWKCLSGESIREFVQPIIQHRFCNEDGVVALLNETAGYAEEHVVLHTYIIASWTAISYAL